MSRVDAVAEAVQAACKGEGEEIVVDLDAFERALKKAKVPVEKANKSALTAELQVLRAELDVQRVRAHHASDEQSHLRRVEELKRRESELVEELWPSEG